MLYFKNSDVSRNHILIVSYLNVPVLVKIVDTCYAASIAVRVVNVADVTCSVSRVTGNHGLKTKGKASLIYIHLRANT